MLKINVIGAGLAGSECALTLASLGYTVNLYDIKTKSKTPAHHNTDFAEIVCSNSLKSDDEFTASGLFKRELTLLNSKLLEVAYKHKVPSGSALAVDREAFAKEVTEKIKNNPNINIFCEDVGGFDKDAITIIATGPLSTTNMCNALKDILGEDFLYFYDAAAPIISADSIDMNIAFLASRYNKGDADYINCPMDKDEYTAFYNELVNAEVVQLHNFEKQHIFESCMPVEIMAKRGYDALRYGPLKPVGITNPHKKDKAFAVIQLRKENKYATMYNMVGFQTNLTFPEQRRVFRMIPGLKNAEFLRYGVMHTNNFINFPKCLDVYSRLKVNKNIFIAGQLSGVEGYVESIASGLYVALNVDRQLKGKELIKFSANTIIGGLYNYLVSANSTNFQPINANYGILNPLKEKNKQLRNEKYLNRSLAEIKEIVKLLKE